MPNTLTNLNHTIITNAALEAFTAALTPLSAFSLNVSPDPAQRGDKVKVLWTPAQAGAIDFAGTYTMQDSTAEGKDVSLDRHKFASWSLTDKEIANQPQIELERFGQQKGFQLAKAVVQDIFGLILAANFAEIGHTGLAANFDSDSVVDIGKIADDNDWPEMGRALVLSAAYHAALRKDPALKDASAYAGGDVIRRGQVPSLDSFEAIYKSSLVPANGENLVGFAATADAMLVAMRYLQPQEGHKYHIAEPVTDPATGISMGYRQWYSEDTGASKAALEVVYGRLTGNPKALLRVRSAA